MGGTRSKKQYFPRFRVPFDYLAHNLRETVLVQTIWYRWKAETLKVCLLLFWRVCDQEFGRYRPLNGAEKWSHDHHENWNLHIETRRKIHWFQNTILIDLWRKITKLSWKNRFRRVASPGACERLAILNWRSSSIHSSSSYYYAALLHRRGPHIALHSVYPSVCLSVCPSVPLSLASVTSRHLANYNDTCTFRHTLRAAYRTAISAAQILVHITLYSV